MQNDYFAGPENQWFGWGVTWGRHKSYVNLPDFQAGLGIDPDGLTLDPAFANLNGLDLRVPSKVILVLKESNPQGTVPGVNLGVDGKY